MVGVPFSKGFDARRGPGNAARSRSASLVALIREKTKDGRLLVEQALRVLTGEETTTIVNNTGEFIESPPTLKDKAEARQWLSARGYGTPVPADKMPQEPERDDEALDATSLAPPTLDPTPPNHNEEGH